MNIYATIDVAAITEEVVEGVYAGQIYRQLSPLPFLGHWSLTPVYPIRLVLILEIAQKI